MGVQHSSSAGAKLEGSSFARANLKRASGLSLRGCGTQVLQAANLRDQVSHLQNLSFVGADLDYHLPQYWIKFAWLPNLSGSSLHSSKLEWIKFAQ